MDMSLSKLQELVKGKPGVLQSMGSQSVRHDWVTEQQQQSLYQAHQKQNASKRKSRWGAGLAWWLRGKELPAIQELQERVWFLGSEDPLEEEMAIHSSILAWEIPWTEEPGGLQSIAPGLW